MTIANGGNRLFESIAAHEGLRLFAYRDHLGFWTIGYGTNVETHPVTKRLKEWLDRGASLQITESLARDLLVEKVATIRAQLQGERGFLGLSYTRRDVITEMAYQLGVSGCREFVRMWAAIRRDDHHEAADEMLDSKWAREQTPGRAALLAKRYRTNVWDVEV